MIDEAVHRVALTLAAFALLAAGLSVVRLSEGDAVSEAATQIASHLARQLDALSRLDAEVVAFASSRGSATIPLPQTLHGSAYRVELRSHQIRVVTATVVQGATIREPIHPFPPTQEAYSREEMDRLDASSVGTDPGVGFVAVRTERLVDGVPMFLTFVHLPA